LLLTNHAICTDEPADIERRNYLKVTSRKLASENERIDFLLENRTPFCLCEVGKSGRVFENTASLTRDEQ
jgi:DNA-binding sugar fermentation-stimulating protein